VLHHARQPVLVVPGAKVRSGENDGRFAEARNTR
jgi:hypothetical protein